jgi:hypothetical protein
MTLKSILAVAVIVAVPFCAQAQPKGDAAAKKATNADAQKVVKIISADKAKTQAYCDMGKLGEQMAAADQAKDTKKMDDLSAKMDALSAKVGPEYSNLMDGLQDMDENSKDGQAIGATLGQLDKLCTK